MELSRKNKTLFIDRETIYILCLCKLGLLNPVHKLMNQQEATEVDQCGIYQGRSFPFPFLLTPSGEHNEKILKNTHEGEVLDIVCEGKKYGQIFVNEVFLINKEKRFQKIMAGDLVSQRAKYAYSHLGNYAVCGEYEIELQQNLVNIQQKIQDKVKELGAKRITALTLQANPLHRVHERIIRLNLEDSDLLVIFLFRPYGFTPLIPYQLRFKMLQHTINNYFSHDKLIIVPLDDTYLSSGANRIIMDALIAQNFGCNRMVAGSNYMGLSLYYDNNEINNIFNSLKGFNMDIKIINEYVYCTICNTIVCVKSCPHGHHHYVHYRAGTIMELYRLGIPPPPILVRKEISAMILNQLFPDRFKRLEKLYNDIIPNAQGMLNNYSDQEFYLNLLDLYQTNLVT
ncbi:sulfate adenylyltransferase [Helicobacter monodelphidis]|uniref:sulfate adenylyltransferase n=1 Tax=Helicobacter sp. 15-1451 TaxID=2004995 RepID=UPI000DCBAA3C|nr:sulfate adenylyltransferase [Helicobacter sp. 15-1451]RAX57608.1 sulfate adenylyltransferase [Helicobacter sp. 15-1451]